MAGIPPSNLIDKLMKSLQSRSFDNMESCVTDVLAEGFSVINIMTELFDRVSILTIYI